MGVPGRSFPGDTVRTPNGVALVLERLRGTRSAKVTTDPMCRCGASWRYVEEKWWCEECGYAPSEDVLASYVRCHEAWKRAHSHGSEVGLGVATQDPIAVGGAHIAEAILRRVALATSVTQVPDSTSIGQSVVVPVFRGPSLLDVRSVSPALVIELSSYKPAMRPTCHRCTEPLQFDESPGLWICPVHGVAPGRSDWHGALAPYFLPNPRPMSGRVAWDPLCRWCAKPLSIDGWTARPAWHCKDCQPTSPEEVASFLTGGGQQC